MLIKEDLFLWFKSFRIRLIGSFVEKVLFSRVIEDIRLFYDCKW